MDQRRRYRAILGLEQGYSPEQLKRAHRDLAKIWHPDRFHNDPPLAKKAERHLQRINEAHQYLKQHPDAAAPPPKPSPPPDTTAPTSDLLEQLFPLTMTALTASRASRAGGGGIRSGFFVLCGAGVAAWRLNAEGYGWESLPMRAVMIVGGVAAFSLVASFAFRLAAPSRVMRQLESNDVRCPRCGVGIVEGTRGERVRSRRIDAIQSRLMAVVDRGTCMSCGQSWTR